MAIDAYYADPKNYRYDPRWLEEIKKVSHRDFTTGFYYGEAKGPEGISDSVTYIKDYDFVGVVLDYDPDTKRATIEQRNRLFCGDEVEVFGPGKDFFTWTIEDMIDEDGAPLEVANKARQVFTATVPQPVEAKDMIRKKVQD